MCYPCGSEIRVALKSGFLLSQEQPFGREKAEKIMINTHKFFFGVSENLEAAYGNITFLIDSGKNRFIMREESISENSCCNGKWIKKAGIPTASFCNYVKKAKIRAFFRLRRTFPSMKAVLADSSFLYQKRDSVVRPQITRVSATATDKKC